MTRIEEIIRGLEILKAKGANEIYAEHDVIYVNAPRDICSTKVWELENLHWYWNTVVDCWTKFV